MTQLYGNTSLNDHLLKGPDSLIGILMQLHTERVTLCTDIEEIFSQVGRAMSAQDPVALCFGEKIVDQFQQVFLPTSLGQNLHLRQNIK